MSTEDGRPVVGPVFRAPEEATFDMEEPPDEESEERGKQTEDSENASREGAGFD